MQNWIADDHSRSTVKNTIAVLVRVIEEAVRDGIIKVNPARVTGWQKLYKQAEDELLDPLLWPCPTGRLSSSWPTHWWPPPTTGTAAGETSFSSPPAPPPGSVRSPAAASATSTPPGGSGPCGARPHPHPAG
ncbi:MULTISPECIES: hypothetical protein [unclassified Streptomyces]|uniref:hypothetical protein n=1 Tax=unclassified Streptomyces TaxID=2593676 RepID=UPI0033EC5767